MALFHLATITPSKAEVIARWVTTQPWGPDDGVRTEVVGAFRFDDPLGRVGMETHVVAAGAELLLVPLTYRDQPLDGAEDALVGTMEHSALGTRWVYDGLQDPLMVMMLAAVSMTGQGEALGMAEWDDRWYIAPSNLRIRGGGWGEERVPVDRFECDRYDATDVVLRNERLEMVVHRRPMTGPQPRIGLTACREDWSEPVVLTEVIDRTAPENPATP